MQKCKSDSWKLFEKLAAAIHQVELVGAEVKRDDNINGRQFDITVRFSHGPYTYLTVVECKDHSKPVKAEAVDALVTKASDVNANKAIMIAASGFQSGCFEVAERHGIELFTLQEIEEFPKDLLAEGLIPTLSLWNFKLHMGRYSEPATLPEAKNILPFLVCNIVIQSGSSKPTLEALMERLNAKLYQQANQEEKRYRINFPPGTIVTIPDIFSGNTFEVVTSSLSAVEFSYKLVPARNVKWTGLDPYLLRRSYRYRNAITGISKDIPAIGLPVGFDTVMEAGRFYVDPGSGFSYYCQSVEDDLLTMTLIESYQHGDLLTCDLTVDRKDALNYLEITDEAEIARLTAMLESLRRKS